MRSEVISVELFDDPVTVVWPSQRHSQSVWPVATFLSGICVPITVPGRWGGGESRIGKLLAVLATLTVLVSNTVASSTSLAQSSDAYTVEFGVTYSVMGGVVGHSLSWEIQVLQPRENFGISMFGTRRIVASGGYILEDGAGLVSYTDHGPVEAGDAVSGNLFNSELEPGDPTWYFLAVVVADDEGIFHQLDYPWPGPTVGDRSVFLGPPTQPPSLSVIPMPTVNGQSLTLRLTWDGLSGEAAGYTDITSHVIQYRFGEDTSWTAISPTPTGVARQYDHVLTPEQFGRGSVGYRIRATNLITELENGPQGPWSEEMSGAFLSPPRELTATPALQSIALSWMTPMGNGNPTITSYRIENSDDGTSWTELVADTGSTSTSYTHTGLDYSQAVHYRVAVVNDAGWAFYSNAVSATTPPIVVPPPASFSPGTRSVQSIQFSWTQAPVPGTATVVGYEVQYFRAADNTWVELAANTNSSSPTFHDSFPAHPLSAGQPRRYRVRAISSHQSVTSEWTEYSDTTEVLDMDVNRDGNVNADDALIVFMRIYASARVNPTIDSDAGVAGELLPTYIGWLVPPTGGATEPELIDAWGRAMSVEQFGDYMIGGINGVAGVDAADALILYYADAFRDLLGDGVRGGFEAYRAVFLRSLSGRPRATDAQLREMLVRANEFYGRYR